MNHPECTADPADCRITRGMQSATTVAWTQTFNGRGELIETADPNYYSEQLSCAVCGRNWLTYRHLGVVTVKDR